MGAAAGCSAVFPAWLVTMLRYSALVLLGVATLVSAGAPSTAAAGFETELRGLRQAVQQWSSGAADPRSELPRAQAAMAKLEELQADARFAALPEQSQVATLDSCEFLARTLGQHEQAISYAKRVADSPLCQAQGDCFASLASKVISRLRALGRPQEASDYFQKAVAVTAPRSARGGAVGPLVQWTSEYQTPSWFLPSLRAQPWWEPDAMEPPALAQVRAVMAEHFTAMQSEVIRLAGRAGRIERDGGGAGPKLFELQTDHDLVSAGSWTEYLLYDGGRWHEAHCDRLPTVCQVLSSLAAVAGTVEGAEEGGAPILSPGQVTILRMDPGTELGPHCGPRNSRLTAHLPLIVPPLAAGGSQVGVRVGEPVPEEEQDDDQQWRVWEEGKVMIFVSLIMFVCCNQTQRHLLNLALAYVLQDDSFEHEARWPEPAAAHHGTTARYVLYASLWHPDLGEPTLPEARRWEKQKGGGRRKKGKARKHSEL